MFSEFNWMDALADSPIFLVLLVCSVITFGVAVERLYYFFKRRGRPEETMALSIKKIKNRDLKEAYRACESSPHPMGAVALQIFEGKDINSEPVEERLQISLSEQKMLFEKNLGVLGTMAAVAPLIGLLGTIWGIMRAFSNMAAAGSAAPSVVAAGVAEALLTTAGGIVIAVPAIMLYNHFSRRANVILTVAENNARSLRALIMETGS
ncbi:MAG: MotA/TolQ/ExbB proton channel family protein [Candidatus Krumholzibacteriota bacterium]|nr:MotA/TolQ/ExbB proton channel family protein [Candidatus Krumholzibacteriota bacterium]